jgi:hypothetical protein
MRLTEIFTLNENQNLIQYLTKSSAGSYTGDSMIRLVLDRNINGYTAWYRLETDSWFRRYFNPGKGYGVMIRKFRISGSPKYKNGEPYYPVVISYLPNSFDNVDDNIPSNWESAKGFLILDKTIADDFRVEGHVSVKDIERFVNSHIKNYTP